MPKDTTEPINGRESRRSFLVNLGLGAAALAAVSSPFLRSRRASSEQSSATSEAFPGEDSIFHPAQDPRQDPRRKNQS